MTLTGRSGPAFPVVAQRRDERHGFAVPKGCLVVRFGINAALIVAPLLAPTLNALRSCSYAAAVFYGSALRIGELQDRTAVNFHTANAFYALRQLG